MRSNLKPMRVLLIMRDAPDTETNKGGLFPTAIKQHVDLGYDVFVASMSPILRHHEEVIRKLGAKPFRPRNTLIRSLKNKLRLIVRPTERAPGPDLSSLPNIKRIGRTVSPDVVTGLQSYTTGLIAMKIANHLDAKVVTWEHVGSYKHKVHLSVPDRVVGKFFSECHAVLAVSNSLLSSIETRFSLTLPNTHVLPNPIPTNFSKVPNSTAPDWLARVPKTDFVFASWTSWRKVKRLDLLLHAFAAVHRANRNVTLIVAGSMKQEVVPIVEDFINRNPSITDNVIFSGRLDRTSIRYLAEFSDCCVISSDSETFGLSMAESFAVGKPVLSTRCGGPEDFLHDRRLGALCEKDDADKLSAAMLNMIDDYSSYSSEKIARIGRELLGEDVIKKKWAAVYESIQPRSSEKP